MGHDSKLLTVPHIAHAQLRANGFASAIMFAERSGSYVPSAVIFERYIPA